MVTNETEIAEYCNSYFVSNVTNLTRQFVEPKLEDFSYIRYNISVPFQLMPTYENEIRKVIIGLNSNAATGVDGISIKLLKYVINYITPQLTSYINSAFATSIFPDCCKLARVLPVFKSGNENDISNYRPISILPAISKIYEKVILNRLNEFLSSNNILNENQFGFTIESNTTAACLNLTNFLSKSFDKKLYCGCLFLDLRKAFDTLDHSILLFKLIKLGFTNQQLEFFRSYLTSRKQVVKINQVISSEKLQTTGVPQGSILGPALFNIYINDLISYTELKGNMQLFADDAVIMYAAESLDDLLSRMQCDLRTLKCWLDLNHLILNHEKTQYIVFENKTLGEDVLNANPISYDSFTIERVQKYTYLGLAIDSKLCWSNHIDKIKKSILPYIFAINRIKHLLPKSSLLLLYFAYIHSRIVYLNPIWSGCAEYRINELEILQKRVLKHIIRAPIRYSTQKLFEEFQSVHFLIDRELLILIHKIINHRIKHNFELITVDSRHEYATRRKSHFIVDFFATSASNNNILYRGLLKYNNLPPDIKHIECLRIFKNKINDFLRL